MCKCEMSSRLVIDQRRGFLVERQRPRRKQELGAFGKLVEVMCPGLQLRHSANEQRKFLIAQPKLGRDEGGQPGIFGLAHVMAVQILEFLEVEPRRALADVIDVEPLDRLLAADDLVVSMAPAKPEQIVEQRLGQDAQLVAIGIDTKRAMALAELGPVKAVNQRD